MVRVLLWPGRDSSKRALDGVTGTPLAIGLGMILDGTITQKGVFAPEGGIEPIDFFRRYSKHWMSPPEQDGLFEEWIEELS